MTFVKEKSTDVKELFKKYNKKYGMSMILEYQKGKLLDKVK